MDESEIYKRLAEAWCTAAREATNSTLKACYADRAAEYRTKAVSGRSLCEAASGETEAR